MEELGFIKGGSVLRLDEAISDLRWIQERIRFTDRANCFRPTMIAWVGCFAFLAGLFQPHVANDAAREPWSFFGYWVMVAGLVLLIVGVQIAWRYWVHSGDRERWQARQSLLDFSPCIMVGGVFSVALMLSAPQHAVLLPSFWACCFSLGIFALRHRLPDGMLFVAGFYLLAAIICLRIATSDSPFTPWTISTTFGLGHVLTAGILYVYERDNRENSQ